MNITDLKEGGFIPEGIEIVQRAEEFTTDKLERVFFLQRYLHEKYRPIERKSGIYKPDKIDINSPRDQEYLSAMMMRVIRELIESIECLKNKPWRQSHVITDMDHMKEELSDAFHFYIEFLIELGIDANELYELYTKKMRVNQWRIATKY